MSKRILSRFDSLITEGLSILELFDTNEFPVKLAEWKLKAKQIITVACGEKSHYLDQFNEYNKPRINVSAYSILHVSIALLRAAKDDLENGFLITFKQIIQAEVFDSELEQAKSLLGSGYKNAAAVIAGVVLETAIKELCLNNGIDIERKRLTQLNDDLAKAGVYNKLQQKQITALADIRNNAAHGNYEEFTKEDVERMISDIERFLLNNSS
ncbi:HEPN domain-containing protein [Acinetobacter nosocomialis]|uniref:HEPN domain-containing protein n=1 Tax=Acinetobacter nosocomialis TaxID=106654 RepID=UPI00124FA28D|nr:HEPN domain-containing protein [Acinetobacter nosocomialis]MDB9693077.1 HEPN domain-containing protein [Acinetobacter nosocomialis]MDO7210123.1 HEPN domain-containing protein [Acinetobacter nosocomialis]MDP7776292.1 HEPN domain-containing protein [Acinetobacter nosocomialis]